MKKTILFFIFLLLSVASVYAGPVDVVGQWVTQSSAEQGDVVEFSYLFNSFDTYTYTIELKNSNDGVLMTLEEGTRTGPSSGSILLDTDGLAIGVYTVLIIARTSDYTDTQNLDLSVIEPNVTLNNNPVIISEPVTTASINQQYVYDVDATDADGDVLSYSIVVINVDQFVSNNFDGIIDSVTGVITWIPSTEEEYSFTVMVTDGHGGVDEQRFNVLVNAEVPNEPYFTNVPGEVNLVYNEEYSFQFEAADPEGDAISFRLIDIEPGMSITSDGLFTWRAGTSNMGRHFEPTVQVTDGISSSYYLFKINVVSANSNELMPEFSSPVDNSGFYSNTEVRLEGRDKGIGTHYTWLILLNGVVEDHFMGELNVGSISIPYNFLQEGLYEILFRTSLGSVWSDVITHEVNIISNPNAHIQFVSYENHILTLEANVANHDAIASYDWEINGVEYSGPNVVIEFRSGVETVDVSLSVIDVRGTGFTDSEVYNLDDYIVEIDTEEVSKIKLNDLTYIKQGNDLHVFVNIRNIGNTDENVGLRINIESKVQYDSFRISKNDVLQRHLIFRNLEQGGHILNAEATVGSDKYTINRVARI
jgi:hypothetical protein